MVAKAESVGSEGGVKVVEFYKDYSPPFNACKAVRRLLEYVPEKYLKGLRVVTLTNSQGTRSMRKGRTRWRGQRVRRAACNGFYGAGQLTLIIDNIFRGGPNYELRLLPFVGTFLIGEVLYHEIGHHIHRTHRPDRRDKEFLADEWGDKLLRSYLDKRYWYVKPLAVPYMLLIRPLLTWLQGRGEKKGDG